MKQIYFPYTEWEDYLNGMYELNKDTDDEYLISKAIDLLSNQDLFFNTALEVMKNWVKSADVNLSNKNSNRRSWIGQSACFYAEKVPELLTREAWARMTPEYRNDANKTAEKIIRIYEEQNRRIHKSMGEKRLF